MRPQLSEPEQMEAIHVRLSAASRDRSDLAAGDTVWFLYTTFRRAILSARSGFRYKAIS